MQGFAKKKPLRYIQPKGIPPYAYFPRCQRVSWPEILADPNTPIGITEGEFKALAACICGFPTIALGGVYNFTREGALLPELERIAWEGRRVFIVFDSDKEEKSDVLMAERLCAELVKRGAIPHLMRLPQLPEAKKTGLDDFLHLRGAPALVELVGQTPPADPGQSLVVEGTDVEIADSVLRDLADKHLSHMVFCEGEFHAYGGTHWRPLPVEEIRNAIFRYDKLRFKPKSAAIVKLSKQRADSILSIMRDCAAKPNFFAEAPAGINCASGFIVFDDAGNPNLEPHDREHRQRHCLPGSWEPGASGQSAKLLHTLLQGCFGTDADFKDRVMLMQEICGVAALGIGTTLTAPRCRRGLPSGLRGPRPGTRFREGGWRPPRGARL